MLECFNVLLLLGSKQYYCLMVVLKLYKNETKRKLVVPAALLLGFRYYDCCLEFESQCVLTAIFVLRVGIF